MPAKQIQQTPGQPQLPLLALSSQLCGFDESGCAKQLRYGQKEM
jgi:hypothetical protein